MREMIMKKIFVILLTNAMSVHISNSQTLIQQIENAYNALDSTSYIENVILSYKEEKLKRLRETEDYMLESRGVYNNMDSLQRQKMLDSIMEKYNTTVLSLSYKEELTNKKVWEEIHITHSRAIADAYLNIDDSIQKHNTLDSLSRDFSKIWMERDCREFISDIKNDPAHYVLNLVLQNELTLQVDTGKLSFNLFCFDRNYKGSLYVYCEDGQYSWQDYRYITFSRKLSKNAPKVFKKIMQKRPKYLLYCYELEEMNTILYVLNDKIYVYRIIQMEEYELNEYAKKFKPQLYKK
jgi:hypothetical protein